MLKRIRKQKGFTLVEMLVAMSIFAVFVGVMIGSYTGIVRGQREANDYRTMYAESRRVFESVIYELRDGMVDYGCNNVKNPSLNELYLISKDGKTHTHIFEKEGVLKMKKGSGEDKDLNSFEVKAKNVKFNFYPAVDPYDSEYVMKNGYQFHPFVNMKMTFEKEKRDGSFFTVDLETTISSRIYNQAANDIKCS